MNYLDNYNLRNQTAIIIGGLGLIGKEICKSLTDANCKVILLDNNLETAESFIKNLLKEDRNVKFEKFDCSDLANLEKNFNRILSKYKNLGILVNCSYPRTKDWKYNTFDNNNFNSFRENIDIHLNTYSWLAHLFAKKVKKNKHLKNISIIQMSSIYGLVSQDMELYKNTESEHNMTYPIIKSGIINFTKQLASFYGKNNIRVNSVCPGPILGHVPGVRKNQSLKFKKKLTNRTFLKRMGKTSDIAAAVLFLASNSSSYITGTTLIVDGGWTAK